MADEEAISDRRRAAEAELAAIRAFVTALEAMPPPVRSAALRWLMAKFHVRWP